MAFPSTPYDGQQYTQNGFVYQYYASLNLWKKVSTASTSTASANITSLTSNTVSIINDLTSNTANINIFTSNTANVDTLTANVFYLNTLVANGTVGTFGQVLKSNGQIIYWANTGEGYTGSVGSQGDLGYTGSKGDQGTTGYAGSIGSQGDLGYTGSIGSQGNIGYTGSKGDLGYTGSIGSQGDLGYTGSTGSQGTTGYVGSKGDQGNLGYTGSIGSQGDLGYTGSIGSQGSLGYQGSAGISGGSTASIRQQFTGNGTNTVFTVAGGYNAGQLDIFLNGVKLNQDEVITSSGSTFTISTAPPVGAVIEALSTFGSFDSTLYVNTSANYTLTGGIAFRGTTNATTFSVNTFLSVGNSTVNTYITPGNVYLNGSTLVIGNTSSNVTVNSTAVIIGTTILNTTTYGGTANNASYLGGVLAANYVQNTDSRTLSGNLTLSGITYHTYSGGSDASIVVSGRNDRGGGGVGAYYNDFMKVTGGNGVSNVYFRTNFTSDLQILRSDYGAAILNVTQGGILEIGGGTAASANSQNDATINYIKLNNNNSQIYDDGNFHIHSRGAGQSMWINTNNGQIIIGNQAVAGGSRASAITMGSSTSATAYVSIYGSKSYAVSGYGYLAASSGSPSGYIAGSSGTVPYSLYCDNRINATEFDATSDERAKDIQGTIPLDTAIDFVKKVDGIHYTWNQDAVEHEDKGLKAGFGAQSVHKAGFDHMVGAISNEKMKAQTDEDGWVHPEGFQLTMGYNQAIAYHHEVIKHLLNKIEKLEEDIKILKETK